MRQRTFEGCCGASCLMPLEERLAPGESIEASNEVRIARTMPTTCTCGGHTEVRVCLTVLPLRVAGLPLESVGHARPHAGSAEQQSTLRRSGVA